jgi:hypothetical protein
VSNLDTTAEQNAKTQDVELIDCGEASKETRGFPFYWNLEMAPPPWDKSLV